MISIIILLIVFILIAVRRIGNIRLQIWQIMLLGAIGVLFSGQITAVNAIKSVNLDVMLFLFGMFVIGQALDDSGYLSHLSCRFFRKARSLDSLILAILFGMGIMSIFLMNDTVAIIGTPVVLLLAKKTGVYPKILLTALAFAVTIGSATSPIGNPQNLLIAINGNITSPFITFFKFLLLPTIVNLFLTYLLIRLTYQDQFHGMLNHYSEEPIKDLRLARLCKVSLILLIVLILTKIATVLVNPKFDFRLTYIALISALPVLFSPKRFSIIRKIDWYTLIFFAAMFILMESVWDSGFFQSILNGMHLKLTSLSIIFLVSVLLSQLISNVPLVALYLPMLTRLGASTKEMVALAAASTIAGNLTILGAASNVIIIQNAEMKSAQTLTFLEFVKIGVPLTIINVIGYWLFLHFIP